MSNCSIRWVMSRFGANICNKPAYPKIEWDEFTQKKGPDKCQALKYIFLDETT